MAGKGTVGRVEEVVPFIEDIAGRQQVVSFGAESSLNHDQCMIGDNQISLARAVHAALDKATSIVGTGRVDAFAAPIGKAQRLAPADQIHKPGREVAAKIAVSRRGRPAQQKAESDGFAVA